MSETMTSIQKFEYQTPSSFVFSQLKEKIVNGIWKAGEKIPSEAEIIRMTGASRSAVREAIKRLCGMGLLYTRQGDGTYVNKAEVNDYIKGVAPILLMQNIDYKELQEYRLMTEPEVAYMAAQKATKQDTIDLEKIIRQQENHLHDINEYVKDDVEFHSKVAEATHNKVLISVNAVIAELNEYAIKKGIEMNHWRGAEFHRKILNAIVNRDPDEACKQMREHILSNIEAYNKAKLK